MDVLGDELLETGLVNGDFTGMEARNFLLVDVDAYNIIAGVSEAGSGDQAHVAGADDGQFHVWCLISLEAGEEATSKSHFGRLAPGEKAAQAVRPTEFAHSTEPTQGVNGKRRPFPGRGPRRCRRTRTAPGRV